ncbi:hypothetical protein ELY33_01000 [Vreelandella andesensis]|uniref:Inovirus Gp2 family protein n=1 Tax=Vreelandella andesensis TaxID=447567 RepID=A0A433KYN7_9GAMM|nr:hypothetical protein [Halomonas andesensis]RUR34788.1 hypothetical protein ELY33_01000 [Halomonas andesensis]
MSKLHPIHKEQMDQFIATFDPCYFLTLNFSVLFDITRDRALAELNKFIIKVNNFLFGRRDKRVLKMLPVLEMGADRCNHINVLERQIRTNWHIHLIIEDPYKRSEKVQKYSFIQMKEIIADIWGSSSIADSSYTTRYDSLSWFKPINYSLGVLEYVYKETGHLFPGKRSNINELAIVYELVTPEGIKL